MELVERPSSGCVVTEPPKKNPLVEADTRGRYT
jgi:hypothetical protein